jgi:hypothetical protein
VLLPDQIQHVEISSYANCRKLTTSFGLWCSIEPPNEKLDDEAVVFS